MKVASSRSMGRSEVLHEDIRTAAIHCARSGGVMDRVIQQILRVLLERGCKYRGARRLSRFSEEDIQDQDRPDLTRPTARTKRLRSVIFSREMGTSLSERHCEAGCRQI